MDHHPADADRVRRVRDAEGSVPEQRSPESSPLMFSIYRQTGENHDGDGIGHVPPESARHDGLRDSA